MAIVAIPCCRHVVAPETYGVLAQKAAVAKNHPGQPPAGLAPMEGRDEVDLVSLALGSAGAACPRRYVLAGVNHVVGRDVLSEGDPVHRAGMICSNDRGSCAAVTWEGCASLAIPGDGQSDYRA